METNILKLPNELLHLILKNLSGCDLVSFAQLCRRFSNLCQTLRYIIVILIQLKLCVNSKFLFKVPQL